MKGCLTFIGIVALVVGLGIAGCIGFGAYRFSKVQAASQAAFAELHQIDAQMPFTAPATSVLDAARLDAFVAAREAAIQPGIKAFRNLDSLEPNPGFVKGVKNAMGAVGDLLRVTSESPRALAAALREQSMSFAEYKWHLETVLGTIYASAAAGDPRSVELKQKLERMMAETELDSGGHDPDVHVRLDELARRCTPPDPASLDLVLARADAMWAEKGAIAVDLFLIRPEKQPG